MHWLFFLLAPFVLHAHAAGFSDVPTDHPHAEAIRFVRERAIVTGYPDGTFRPDQAVARAELAKMLLPMRWDVSDARECVLKRSSGFSLLFQAPDVNIDAWYAPYLCQLLEKGIMSGDEGKLTMRPSDPVNVAEAAKMFTLMTEEVAPQFQSPWYRAYLEFLGNEKHILPDTLSQADASMTRGEVAEMLYRWLAKRNDLPFATYAALSISPFTGCSDSGHTPASGLPLSDSTKVFCSEEAGLSLRYPADWSATSESSDMFIFARFESPDGRLFSVRYARKPNDIYSYAVDSDDLGEFLHFIVTSSRPYVTDFRAIAIGDMQGYLTQHSHVDFIAEHDGYYIFNTPLSHLDEFKGSDYEKIVSTVRFLERR